MHNFFRSNRRNKILRRIEFIPTYHGLCKGISQISLLLLFIVYNGDYLTLRLSTEFNGFKQRDYQSYLQYPNQTLFLLSNIIVGDSITDDEKVEKILVWVTNSFKYESDLNLYGELDKWVKPIDSLRIMKGDCEDGAFLIHSLLLHVKIDPKKISTSGGIVKTYKAKNAKMVFSGFGGHAWTSYKRQSDGEWIALDWCNMDETKILKDIKPIRKDNNYVSSIIEFNYLNELVTKTLNIKDIES